MRAIVDIQGKQYEVAEGRYIQVDLCAGQENDTLVFENVRLIVAGDQSLVGAPYIEGAVVTTRVKRHGRGPKVLVYKMRCKKGYRRKNGHRQDFTELQIESVDFPGKDKVVKIAQPEAVPTQRAEKPKVKKSAAATKAKAKVAPEAVTAVEEKPEKAPAKPKTAKTAAKPKAKAAETSGGEEKKAKKAKAPKAEAEAPPIETQSEVEAATTPAEESVVEAPPITKENQAQPGETE